MSAFSQFKENTGQEKVWFFFVNFPSPSFCIFPIELLFQPQDAVRKGCSQEEDRWEGKGKAGGEEDGEDEEGVEEGGEEDGEEDCQEGEDKETLRSKTQERAKEKGTHLVYNGHFHSYHFSVTIDLKEHVFSSRSCKFKRLGVCADYFCCPFDI